MFTVSVETHFWASHQLRLADGSKEAEHWHNWLVAADISGDKLDGMGLVIDFGLLREQLKGIVGEFGNNALEKNACFQRNNASAENVARYIYEKLEPKLPKNVKLAGVRVVEEPGCSAKFVRNNEK